MSLSDKIINQVGELNMSDVYLAEDVKEFIRDLKGMIEFELKPVTLGMAISDRLASQINKLAGEELI